LSDSYVILPDDSSFTGKKVDNEQVTVSGTDVQRQRVQIAGSAETEIAGVTAANGLDVDVTRVTGTVTVGDGGSTLSVDDAGTTLSVDDGGGSLTVDGTVSINGTPSVTGSKTPNLAVPGSTNIGVLGAVANNSAPTMAEGFLNPLSVDLAGSLRVTGGTGSPSQTDDTAFTTATDKVSPIGGLYDADGSSVLTDGHVALARLSRNRNQHVKLMDGVGDNEFGAEVDSAGRVSVALKNITSGLKIESVGDVGNAASLSAVNPVAVGVRAYAAAPSGGAAGASADGQNIYLWADYNGRLQTNSTLVTPNLDSAMDDTVDSVKVTGSTAHDAVDAGNPTKIGGIARQTNPTAVSDADRTNATFDDLGRQIVVLNNARDLVFQQTTTITNSTAETTIATAVASTFLDLTSLVITNATATAVVVTIKDDTAGTTRAIYALAANGGVVDKYVVPFTQTAVNKNWTATLSVNTVTVYFNVQGVKNI